jgi:hypothetical protein
MPRRMAAAPRPIAPTSFPGTAEMSSQQGAKTFDNADFGWDVDWLPIYRALALLGVFLLLIGSVLWQGLPGMPGSTPSFTPWIGTLFVAILLFVGGTMTVFVGYTEEGVACLVGAVVSGLVTFGFPYTQIPAGYPLLTNPGPYGTDFGVVMSLLVAGVAALVVGLVQTIRTYLATIREEGPREPIHAPRAVPEKHP